MLMNVSNYLIGGIFGSVKKCHVSDGVGYTPSLG